MDKLDVHMADAHAQINCACSVVVFLSQLKLNFSTYNLDDLKYYNIISCTVCYPNNHGQGLVLLAIIVITVM